jgi:hypothetical protein
VGSALAGLVGLRRVGRIVVDSKGRALLQEELTWGSRPLRRRERRLRSSNLTVASVERRRPVAWSLMGFLLLTVGGLAGMVMLYEGVIAREVTRTLLGLTTCIASIAVDRLCQRFFAGARLRRFVSFGIRGGGSIRVEIDRSAGSEVFDRLGAPSARAFLELNSAV